MTSAVVKRSTKGRKEEKKKKKPRVGVARREKALH